MNTSYDLVVIGSGPGGQQAAISASKMGKRVAIVEREKQWGGACIHKGIIPSKTLREAALTITNLRESAQLFDFSLRNDMEVSTLVERMRSVMENYASTIEKELEYQRIHSFKAKARIRDPQTVSVQTVDGRIEFLDTQNIIIATGSQPRHPNFITVDHEHILDSDSILSLLYLPKSLAVIGAGIIGSEYASIFSILGVHVTLIDEAHRPMAFLDHELTDYFVEHFENTGSRYLGNQTIKTVCWNEKDAVQIRLNSGKTIESEKLLVASGRIANTDGLGLEALGIEKTSGGHIKVDSNYQTSLPGIYAVGDVIGYPALVSSSMEQGKRAARHCFEHPISQPFETIPFGIYAVPEIASVGIDEKTAIERHGAGSILVGKADFGSVARGQISGTNSGILKLVAKAKTLELLGVQIVGNDATELIHLGELALTNKNTVNVFIENVLNFPTLSEAYRIAAIDVVSKNYL